MFLYVQDIKVMFVFYQKEVLYKNYFNLRLETEQMYIEVQVFRNNGAKCSQNLENKQT